VLFLGSSQGILGEAIFPHSCRSLASSRVTIVILQVYTVADGQSFLSGQAGQVGVRALQIARP